MEESSINNECFGFFPQQRTTTNVHNTLPPAPRISSAVTKVTLTVTTFLLFQLLDCCSLFHFCAFGDFCDFAMIPFSLSRFTSSLRRFGVLLLYSLRFRHYVVAFRCCNRGALGRIPIFWSRAHPVCVIAVYSNCALQLIPHSCLRICDIF